MNYIFRLVCIHLLLVFSACGKNDLIPETITMRVAEHARDCIGVVPQKCLWIKIEGNPNWTLHYAGIEGFVYEEGFKYTLIVEQKRVDNPPMDGSSIHYKLVKVVEKIKQ